MLFRSERISCVICTPEIASLIPDNLSVATSHTPKQTAMLIAEKLVRLTDYFWKSFDSVIPDSCQVHPKAFVANNDVVLGERCMIGPGAVILGRSILGDDVRIGPNCSIATDAFDTYDNDGSPILIPQAGGVRIGSRTTILANSCIDRSCFASAWTSIGEDCVIDKLTNIAHDVEIGDRCRIGGNVGIYGRVTIGADSYVAPTATIVNGKTLGEEAFVTMGSMVTKDVPAGQRVTGYFAEPHDTFLKRLRKRAFDD